MNLQTFANAVITHPELSSHFTFDTLTAFLDILRILRPVVELSHSVYIPGPPKTLPINVQEFLALTFSVGEDVIQLAWSSFQDAVWSSDPTLVNSSSSLLNYAKRFVEHGLSRNIALYNFIPPTRTCLDTRCQVVPRQSTEHTNTRGQPRALVEPITHPITVFSHDTGTLPGFTTSLYCRKCHTRYHPNYYVHRNATLRTYYSETSLYIQIAQKVYISSHLCELFANMMVFSWTSASNCARIYNEGLMDPQRRCLLPVAYSKSLLMDGDDVWDAFFLYSLMIDHASRAEKLQLPHDAPSQHDRLRDALEARNLRMVGPGQEEWNHACDECCWFHKDEAGQLTFLRSAVVDGVTIGRPCCSVHNCDNRLDSVQDRFCPDHSDRNNICAFDGCENHTSPGFLTCAISEHRAKEEYKELRNKAMFVLKSRLKRSAGNTPIGKGDYENTHDEADELDDDADGCEGKPEEGNRKAKVRLHRSRTHNEELCFASCGVCLGRATMFGAEGTHSVRTFIMRLFPTKQSLPGVIWHDNNCRLLAMLQNDTDPYLRTYFDNIALPVDVFHFKCKHKESDEFCGTHCNPYLWPELRTAEGNWRFNSSAAEQGNAWFGRYNTIVREMKAERYDFFLDEMIRRRNRHIIGTLAKRGKAPHHIPRGYLLDGSE